MWAFIYEIEHWLCKNMIIFIYHFFWEFNENTYIVIKIDGFNCIILEEDLPIYKKIVIQPPK